jgi:hypothetical protein
MRILRSGVVVGAIGALSVVVAEVGVATAANGGALVLGRSRSRTHSELAALILLAPNDVTSFGLSPSRCGSVSARAGTMPHRSES